MKKTRSLALATLLGLLWALPLVAQNAEEETGEEQPDSSRQSVWEESQRTLLQGVELSAEQQAEIDALDAEYAEKFDEQRRRRSQLQRDLAAAQEAGRVSESKRLRGQLRKMRRAPGRAAHVGAIRKLLNPQQRATFDENRKAFRELARQRRARAERERPPRPAPAADAADGEAPAKDDREDPT